jgi:hypothetical protein
MSPSSKEGKSTRRTQKTNKSIKNQPPKSSIVLSLPIGNSYKNNNTKKAKRKNLQTNQ